MKSPGRAVLIVLYVIITAIAYYLILPPFNWHSPAFWAFFTPAVCALIFILALPGKNKVVKMNRYIVLVIAAMFVVPAVLWFAGTRIFHAKEYASRINIDNVSFDTIDEVDFTKTAIIDRDTTEALGDRVMGQMSELVSQFEVRDEYTQISY